MENNQSDVARVKAEIELQWSAACHAMHGMSEGTLKHEIITARMERMGERHDNLREMIGEGRAAKFLVKTMDRS